MRPGPSILAALSCAVSFPLGAPGDGREFLWMVEESADGAVINGSGHRAEAGAC